MNRRTSTSQFKYNRKDRSNSFLLLHIHIFSSLVENNLFYLLILQYTPEHLTDYLYFLLRGELAGVISSDPPL